MTAGFGRRIIEPSGQELVVIPEAAPPPPKFDVIDSSGVKEQVRAILMTRIDPGAAARMPRGQLLAEISSLVSDIATQARVQLNEREEAQLATELVHDMVGLGPLEPLLADPGITDIMVNGPFEIYVERKGRLEKSSARFRDAQHVVNIAQRIASGVGRRIDEASPMVDARLADGSRVNIVLPPLVLNGGAISIRKFPDKVMSFDTMVQNGSISAEMARFLEIAARCRFNIIVSGGTGSGKTTLLNAISRTIDPGERIITIEDAVELRLQQPHIVQMETRAANIEGVGAVPQRELLRNALRMRPDRIIVGEVRGVEAYDMLQAMNTGHDGSMSTIHANTSRDALYRLENMVLMATANLPLRVIRAQIESAVNLIVQVERMRDGVRRVKTITEIIGMEGDVISTHDVFTFEIKGDNRDAQVKGKFETTKMRPKMAERAAYFGLEKQLLDTVQRAGEAR